MLKQTLEGFQLLWEAIRGARGNVYLPIVARFMFGKWLVDYPFVPMVFMIGLVYFLNKFIVYPISSYQMTFFLNNNIFEVFGGSELTILLNLITIYTPYFIFGLQFIIPVYLAARMNSDFLRKIYLTDIKLIPKSKFYVTSCIVVALFVLGFVCCICSEIAVILNGIVRTQGIDERLLYLLLESGYSWDAMKDSGYSGLQYTEAWILCVFELIAHLIQKAIYSMELVNFFLILNLFRLRIASAIYSYLIFLAIFQIISSLNSFFSKVLITEFQSLELYLVRDFFERPFTLLMWILVCAYLLPTINRRVEEMMSEE